MSYTLTPEIQRLISDHVTSGRYASEEDVLRAALRLLDQAGQQGDFEPGELDRLLEEAETSGEPITAESVFEEIRTLSKKRANRG